MAHPHHHALSSVKKWGGQVSDYLALHEFFDASKAHVADFRHRALRHHSLGIFQLEEAFGKTITLSTGRVIPTRWVGEQHVLEDLGRIPTWADWCRCIRPEPWMSRSKKLSIDLAPDGTDRRIIAAFIPQSWIDDYAVAIDPQGPATFDVTAEIVAMGRDAALKLRDDTDPTDALRHAATCPQWIKDWNGPFIIEVEQAIEAYFDEDPPEPSTEANDVALMRAAAVLAAYGAAALKPPDDSDEGLAAVIADLLHLAATKGAGEADITHILHLARTQHRVEQAATAA